MADLDFSKRIVLSPYDVSIFSLWVLGSLYYRLSLRPNTRRIVYLWSDASLYPGTIHIPWSSGVSQVLGRKIKYNSAFIDGFGDTEFIRDDIYFSKNDLRHTHAHHIAFLQDIEVLPIVFSEDKDLREYTEKILFLLDKDPETVVVMADTINFRIEDTVWWPQILAFKKEYFARFDIFCTYCDRKALTPNIMKVEVVQHNDGDPIYQGLLLV